MELTAMIGAISHRGPDDTGIYFEHGVGLAHARLSIIDLSPLGHQPMWNENEHVGVVFNGEIYNFKILRNELSKYGKVFRSSSDTEVILAMYEQYGEECFSRLEGMFAIALYDKSTQKLILARDRMGKKPLYYGIMGGTLLFASEPSALLCHPSFKKEIDPHSLNAYLALDYVPTPMSIWKGITKLEPGHVLVYQGGEINLRNFWKPDLSEQKKELSVAMRELDDLLAQAVSARMISDVPLGVFLSGGLDSSTIAYYASKASTEPIHTFSIGFEEKSFDESIYAKEVSAYLGTIHHHKYLTAKDTLTIMPQVFAKLDEPMADASIMPTHLLSLFTKEHVTVALGGDGGDELFAGYPTFQAERIVQLFQHLPQLIQHEFIPYVVSMLPTTQDNFGLKFKMEKFLEGANERSIASRHMRWLGAFPMNEREILLSSDVRKEIGDEQGYEIAERYFAMSSQNDPLNSLLWVYQHSYMMDEVMVKVDRASMYAALETRAPFLDRQVVEYANRLPYKMKLHGNTTKYILKKTMEGKLPSHIISREKKGFGIPVGAWLRGELKEWGEQLLFSEGELLNGMIAKQEAQKLWSEHQSGLRDNRKKLWNLLVLLEWEKRFL